MKRIILVLLTHFLVSDAIPQSGGFGLGVILGNPTGISGKLWTGEKSAIDASIGYHIGNINGLRLTADYLVHPWTFESEKDLIKLFFGAGAGLGFISDLSLSLRAPAGAGYYFTSLPLEVFAELVPALQIIGQGDVKFWIGGYLGARWYIKSNKAPV